MRGPCGGKLLPILVGERRQNRFEAFLHLFGTEPCQGADDVPRLAMWGCQLPARSVAKRDGERAEVQSPVWAGGQIDRANRILCGQAQAVSRGATARHDRFAPQR